MADEPSDPILYFEQLTWSDGTETNLSPRGVVVIVGPNNVGKSTALGEITGYVRESKFSHNNKLNRVFASGVLHLPTPEDGQKWMLDTYADVALPEPITQPNMRRFRNWGHNLVSGVSSAAQIFQTDHNRNEFVNFLYSHGMMAAFEGETPDIYGAQGMIGNTNRQYESLYYDPAAERRISELSQKIFRVPVEMTRSGRTSALHFGNVPSLDTPPTDAQRDQLRLVPKVSEQGQGVVSLLNLAITLELGEEPIVILDEPDAHLHPPQARHAGRFVAERGKRSQVFIATHSIDFLLGILDAGAETTIIRLDRTGSTQSVSILDKSELKKSWADPAVRFSGALAGIMHRGVVLCEGDGDCRYYEVALDYLNGQNPHDLRFVQTGGKAGSKKLVKVLRSLAVPTVVITDFDVLREWAELKGLFEAMGGDARLIQPDWTAVNQYIANKSDKRTVSAIRAEFNSVADAIGQSQPYTRAVKESLAATLKTLDGWTEAKEHGVKALKGSAATSCATLLAELRSRGLYVLPFGELESFHREAPTQKGPWMSHVIENGLYKSLEGDEARFIKDIPDVCFNAGR